MLQSLVKRVFEGFLWKHEIPEPCEQTQRENGAYELLFRWTFFCFLGGRERHNSLNSHRLQKKFIQKLIKKTQTHDSNVTKPQTQLPNPEFLTRLYRISVYSCSASLSFPTGTKAIPNCSFSSDHCLKLSLWNFELIQWFRVELKEWQSG